MPKPSTTPRAARDLKLLESLWREQIERYALPNGLTVLLKRDTAAPVASVQVWVKTGSIHEGAHLGAGLSHYLEHMLFKGTERRGPRNLRHRPSPRRLHQRLHHLRPHRLLHRHPRRAHRRRHRSARRRHAPLDPARR